MVENMRYGLIPKGPARRAVVFGGSNVHIFKPEVGRRRRGRRAGRQGAHRLQDRPGMVAQDRLGRLEPVQPPRLQDQVDEGTSRQHQVPRCDDLHAALRHPVPGVPESPEIMNIIVPDMLQNALTETMTVEEAADDAASKIEELMGGGCSLVRNAGLGRLRDGAGRFAFSRRKGRATCDHR